MGEWKKWSKYYHKLFNWTCVSNEYNGWIKLILVSSPNFMDGGIDTGIVL